MRIAGEAILGTIVLFGWLVGCAQTPEKSFTSHRSDLSAAEAETAKPPHIVFFLNDDLGWADVACYGHPFHRTPNIDRLAGEGLRFTHAYSNGPNCAPSRASLMTGQTSPRHGILTVNSSARGKSVNRRLIPIPNIRTLADEAVTLAEVLTTAGYTCAHLGKWHLGADPTTQGFGINIGGTHRGHPKSYFSPYQNPALPDGPDGEYLTDRLTDEALGILETHDPAQPLFLHFSYFSVHTPIQAPAALRDKILARLRAEHDAATNHGAPPKRGATPKHRAAPGLARRAAYAAMVETVDRSIGRVVAKLESLGLAEDTLVIFASDNGGHGGITSMAPLRGAKGMLYEGGIRVPLILRWPGRIETGECAEPVIGCDLPVTLAALGRSQPLSAWPNPSDGVDLSPLFTGRPLSTRSLHWHFPAYLAATSRARGIWRTTPAGAIRSGRYKLLEFFEDSRTELYDLIADPGETMDISTRESDRAIAMLDELRRWRRSVGAQVPTERNPEYQPEH
ncbi:MAG: sulfatase, partial [Planctomycetota bacterium]